MSRSAPPVAAAYGVRIEGLSDSAGLALRGAEAWPAVRMTTELTADPLPRGSVVGDECATIVTPAATLELNRTRDEIRVRAPERVPEADLVHPCLWPAAAVLARWRGAETLHAGAFAAREGEGAWAVMADSGGGKTSFLATLALAGVEVLVDDLLVLEGEECFAGPRALDLRPEVVGRLGLEDRVTASVRATSRERLPLAPCDARWSVRGFVELAWGDSVRVDRLGPAEGLAALARHRRVLGLGAEFAQLLALLERPVLRLIRPRSWTSAGKAGERLLEATSVSR